MVECHSVSHCPPCGQFCMRLYGMKRINAVAYNADGKCTRRHAAAMLARSEGCARELGHDITRAPPWFYPERVRRILNSAKSGSGILVLLSRECSSQHTFELSCGHSKVCCVVAQTFA